MNYDIITIGGAVRDFTFYIQEGEISHGNFIFPLDSKILVQKACFTNGGGANNLAVGLARFGLKVALLGRIGYDFSGQAIFKNLKKHKIETKFVQVDPKLHTGVSVIIQQQGKGKVLFTFRGANEKLQVAKSESQIANSKWVYIASLTGDWQKILDKVFQIPKKSSFAKASTFAKASAFALRASADKSADKSEDKRRYHVVWNPGAAQLAAGKRRLAEYLKRTEILILNRYEAAQLVNSKLETVNRKQIVNLLLKIHKIGPKIVVITAGKQGAYVYDGQQIYYQPAKVKKPKDTTGAGDAFSSGFLAGLVLFDDIKKALNLGILNSAAVIRKVGAQEGLLSLRKIKKLN